MKINFEAQQSSQGIEKNKTVCETGKSQKNAGIKGYKLDSSSMFTDNNAYSDHAKTAEDVMREAGGQDISLIRDYMTIMSNCMSDQDFAKMQKDGINPANMDVETVVTIVDKIKAVMAQSGTEIIGYNDHMDMDRLTEITGSRGLAEAVADCMEKHDVQPTEENVQQAVQAAEKIENIEEPSEGAIKYMVENGMSPTTENFHKAQHSGAADADRQSQGYYAANEKGYLAKKAESYNWEQLAPRLEQVVEEAGLSKTQEAMEEAKWLVEKGIPLTEQSLSLLHQIRGLEFPISQEAAVEAAVVAMSDGKPALQAVIGEKESAAEKAVKLLEDVKEIGEEAADLTALEGKKLNIRNLKEAQYRLQSYGYQEVSANITARRQLEEVRLRMTAEANIRLIKSGYSIETASLSQLVENLKQQESQQNRILFQGTDDAENTVRSSLYADTLQVFYEAASVPAAVIGTIASVYDETDITQIVETGNSLKQAYRKAGETYETLMTEPRRDLGDSIRKAFRNVDDILEDMDFELTEENRRAVRILGYNSMEITEENINRIRLADDSVQEVIRKMTPAAALQMIRDGKNPLTMQLKELENYFSESDNSKETEKYSRFLYKLEQNGEISQEEKESYIGLYRMVRQLEKDDGAAVGSLVEQGVPVTFSNLMTALRSGKKTGMDYKVDDSFAGTYQGPNSKKGITAQIETAYLHQQSEKIYSAISPEAIKLLQENADINWEQAAEQIEAMETDQELLKEEAEVLRQLTNAGDSVLKMLMGYKQPLTPDFVMAADHMLRQRGGTWKELAKNEKGSEKVEKMSDSLLEAMNSKEELQEAYGQLEESVRETNTEYAFSESNTSVDVRQLALLNKQISFRAAIAKEEHYEIPLFIGEELTAVNLKILHNQMGQSKVSVTSESEKLGKTAAEFTVHEGQITGYIACDSKEGSKEADKLKQVMENRTEEAGYAQCRIDVVLSQDLKLDQFEGKQTQDRISTNVSDGNLYRIAKLYLTSFSRI